MYMCSKPGEKPSDDEILIRYYISSRTLSAEQFAESIRSHWHMKIRCITSWMWVSMRTKVGYEQMMDQKILSGSVICVLKKTFKGGVKRKRKMAGMSEAYLEKVLTAL